MPGNKVTWLISIASILLCSGQVHGQGNETQQAQPCTCVQYDQCSDKFVVDPHVFVDIRQDNTCATYLEICCKVPKNITKREISKPKYCGRNLDSSSWVLNLFYQASREDIPVRKCDTSLIHQQAVLTAAHCLDPAGTWSVGAGYSNRRITKVIIHPDYNSVTLENDLALLVLKDPFETSNKLDTICIPPPGIVFLRKRCFVASRNGDDFNSISDLKVRNLTILSNKKCSQRLRNTKLGMSYNLSGSFMCTDVEDRDDAYISEGGSPLLCPSVDQPETYYQAGLLSWNVEFSSSNALGVYVKLGLSKNWIEENLVQNGLEVESNHKDNSFE